MADDKEVAYWNGVYASGKYVRGDIPHDASPFAQDVHDRLKKCISRVEHNETQRNAVVWEWGCGNGRDALFFTHSGLKVVATDLADVSITQLNAAHKTNKGIVFVAADFTRGDLSPEECVKTHFTTHKQPDETPTDTLGKGFVVGAIYSRFTIHSVREENASAAFKWAFDHLCNEGILAIETRSIKDSLCGVGQKVDGEHNAWIEDHYRRFTDKDELAEELKIIGFEIESMQEDTGLAIYKDEDPCVIRIIACKKVSL